MGSSYGNAIHQHRAYEAEQKRAAEAVELERKTMASKIVMAVVDKIVNEIIRPGPKPEERECYEMAGELRSLNLDLETLVKQIIDVNDGIQ